MDSTERSPKISLVIPAYNEETAIDAVLKDVRAVMDGLGTPYEVLVIDDGSTDHTPRVLADWSARYPELRVLTFVRNAGQTAAFHAGFRAARGEIVVTMDGDGQNDPGDIPTLIEKTKEYDAAFGIRVKRQDSAAKLFASRVANRIRNWLLGVELRDTGCSLKAFRAEFVRDMPLFTGFHRFFPSLVMMQGGRGIEVPVRHHPRHSGESKYSTFGRAIPTLLDCLVIRRLQSRSFHYEIKGQGE